MPSRARPPYIRQFENYLDLLLGYKPESCEQSGTCSPSIIIKADGSVYPCDFYMTDDYLLGNIKEKNIQEFLINDISKNFYERSLAIPSKCKTCKYYRLCRNGCYRNRPKDDKNELVNRYCKSYYLLFESIYPRLMELKDLISRRGYNI